MRRILLMAILTTWLVLFILKDMLFGPMPYLAQLGVAAAVGLIVAGVFLGVMRLTGYWHTKNSSKM